MRTKGAAITATRPTYLAYMLTSLRQQYKYSQEEIAKRLGITRSAYSYYELGKSEPNLESMKTLAQLYRLRIDDLVMPQSR